MLLGLALVPAARAASPAVQAAETSVYVDAGFDHTQYHENVNPISGGDDESGFMPGFGIGASALIPMHPGNAGSPDFYTSLNYDFNAGDIKYAGHYQSGGAVDATDNAVQQRIEARIGVGFPLLGGGESIPFVAGGYQFWNRNINIQGQIGSDEFYRSGLVGAGWKFDQPIGRNFVVSVTPEFLGLVGGSISINDLPFGGRGFGVTPEERVELGLDDALGAHLHVFAKADWEHFNYSGTHPFYFIFDGYNYGYVYEPFSTTTQFGMNVGVSYSF